MITSDLKDSVFTLGKGRDRLCRQIWVQILAPGLRTKCPWGALYALVFSPTHGNNIMDITGLV